MVAVKVSEIQGEQSRLLIKMLLSREMHIHWSECSVVSATFFHSSGKINMGDLRKRQANRRLEARQDEARSVISRRWAMGEN